MSDYKLNHIKAIVTISTIEGYKPDEENPTTIGFDEFCKNIQVFEEQKETSISWLITEGRAVYKREWGSPYGGEPVFIMQADYTEYDKGISISDWKRNVFTHVEQLKCLFKQESVRVTFINGVETTILR